MKAVIMAGGFGTRLRPLTCSIPKPMVPMLNRPIMEHIIRLLRAHNITDIVVTLFYHPEIITDYFGDGSRLGVHLRYVKADADYGTAGSVRNAASLLGERFLIISGDVLTDFNLTEAINFHTEREAQATIVLYHSPNPLQYGVVITRGDGRIVRFVEKPTWGEVFSDTINTGIYVIEPDVLECVPKGQEFDFSKDLFPLLLDREVALFGYPSHGYWRDVGNLGEYLDAHRDVLAGHVDVEFPGEKIGTAYVGLDTKVETESSSLKGTVVVGNHCTIGKDALLSNSVVGNNVMIEPDAVIEDSVIWSGSIIHRGAKLSSDVLANNVVIGEGAVVEENVFIGEKCVIGSKAHLMGNIKLWPSKVVEEGAILTRSLVWEDRWLRELFADARVSGYSNIEMNPEFGARLGAAFGAFVGAGKTVVTSRDPDNVSRMMNRALMCGLISAGVNVNDLRATPIPILRHELSTGKEVGGLHVRKSPRNKNVTDIIFFDASGKDLPVSKRKTVERLFFGEEVPRVAPEKVGEINFPERTTESYREKFLSALNIEAIKKAKLKLVLDYSHGITATVFPTLIGSLGCEVIAINAFLDPAKLTREPEETEDALRRLSHIVTSLGYDLGCMFDAGGERLYIIDETGKPISEERLLALVAKLFVMANPKATKIAVPISASMEVDLIASEHGVKVEKTKDTHLAMMNAATELQVEFVGGTRGGFIFPKFSFATDAMFGIAKILEFLGVTGQKLGELDRKLPRFETVKREVPCPWESKGTVMRMLMTESEKMKRDSVDGVKLYLNSGESTSSVLIMPDKERALFHVRAEARGKSAALDLANEYEQKIVRWRDGNSAQRVNSKARARTSTTSRGANSKK
jgi:mannose-1-phosphate guanylyltransferase/phosphomannomutase